VLPQAAEAAAAGNARKVDAATGQQSSEHNPATGERGEFVFVCMCVRLRRIERGATHSMLGAELKLPLLTLEAMTPSRKCKNVSQVLRKCIHIMIWESICIKVLLNV